MSKKQLYFLGGAVFLYVFIMWLIPVPLFAKAGVVLTLLFAAAIAVLIYQAMKPDQQTMYTPENYEAGKSRERTAAFVCAGAAIVTLLSVLIQSGGREAAYIKKNSVVVEGVVTSGEAKTTKRKGSSSTSYELNVDFQVDGKTFNTSVNVDGADWKNAGIGMPVLIAYAKGHPALCRILFNDEQVQKYTNADQIKKLTLAVLTGLINKSKTQQLDMLKKHSIGWSKQEEEDSTTLFYHSVYKSSVLPGVEKLFMIEIGNPADFNALMEEARKKLTVVYDSMATNPKEGVLFKKDSLRFRFQHYRKMNSESDNEYGIPMMTMTNIYAIGIATGEGTILMPGDLAPDPDDPVTRREMMQKAAKEQLEKIRGDYQ